MSTITFTFQTKIDIEFELIFSMNRKIGMKLKPNINNDSVSDSVNSWQPCMSNNFRHLRFNFPRNASKSELETCDDGD